MLSSNLPEKHNKAVLENQRAHLELRMISMEIWTSTQTNNGKMPKMKVNLKIFDLFSK